MFQEPLGAGREPAIREGLKGGPIYTETGRRRGKSRRYPEEEQPWQREEAVQRPRGKNTPASPPSSRRARVAQGSAGGKARDRRSKSWTVLGSGTIRQVEPTGSAASEKGVNACELLDATEVTDGGEGDRRRGGLGTGAWAQVRGVSFWPRQGQEAS